MEHTQDSESVAMRRAATPGLQDWDRIETVLKKHRNRTTLSVADRFEKYQQMYGLLREARGPLMQRTLLHRVRKKAAERVDLLRRLGAIDG